MRDVRDGVRVFAGTGFYGYDVTSRHGGRTQTRFKRNYVTMARMCASAHVRDAVVFDCIMLMSIFYYATVK